VAIGPKAQQWTGYNLFLYKFYASNIEIIKFFERHCLYLEYRIFDCTELIKALRPLPRSGDVLTNIEKHAKAWWYKIVYESEINTVHASADVQRENYMIKA
jgi:hypothetical protein